MRNPAILGALRQETAQVCDDYALIATRRGRTPMMLITRVRIEARGSGHGVHATIRRHPIRALYAAVGARRKPPFPRILRCARI